MGLVAMYPLNDWRHHLANGKTSEIPGQILAKFGFNSIQIRVILHPNFGIGLLQMLEK